MKSGQQWKSRVQLGGLCGTDGDIDEVMEREEGQRGCFCRWMKCRRQEKARTNPGFKISGLESG